MRLTKKMPQNEYDIELDKVRIRQDVLMKLGQLEDIEDELGIDLVEALKLCKKVNEQKIVYIKENWGIDTLKIFDDLDVELLKHRLYVNSRGMYIDLNFKDYGKTWALTKEELL